MAYNGDVPALLEQFMEESGTTRRWVTVHEIRSYFNLDETVSPAISGFLQRNYSGTFLSFPYRVERMEKVTLDAKPHPRTIKKYLVSKRPASGLGKNPPGVAGTTSAGFLNVFTDYDAVEHFDRVIGKKSSDRNKQT
jgi:hypothetical protein